MKNVIQFHFKIHHFSQGAFHNFAILNLQESKDITLSNNTFSEFNRRKMEINCWPELSANFGPNFESFLQQELFSDVTLIAQDVNGHDVKFPVHRFVLASTFPYVCLLLQKSMFYFFSFQFEKMFTVQMKEADAKEIPIGGKFKIIVLCIEYRYMMN